MSEKVNIPAPQPGENPGHSAPAALIQEAIAGKRQAQKEIYDRYAPFIYGVIRRYIRDEALAGEILNDTFYKILTRLKDYRFRGAFEGWMRTTAVYTITDHVRRHARHNGAMQEMPESFDAGVEQSVTAGIAYKDLLQMVHELPDVQRAVFNLFVFESYAHKDIAMLLSISENNSRWHLNDARRRLKDKIKPFIY